MRALHFGETLQSRADQARIANVKRSINVVAVSRAHTLGDRQVSTGTRDRRSGRSGQGQACFAWHRQSPRAARRVRNTASVTCASR